MKKAFSRKSKWLISIISIVGAIFVVSSLSVILAKQEKAITLENNTSSLQAASTDTTTDGSEVAELNEKISTITSNSTYSKEIPVSLNVQNIPNKESSNEILYVNGFDQPVLRIWLEGDNVYAQSTNPLRIENVSNYDNINSKNYDIVGKSYNSSPYSIVSDGSSNGAYKQNALIDETHLDWTVQNETFVNPYDNTTKQSGYIEFTGITQPKKIASVANGYAEVNINLTLPNALNYNGPNVMDIIDNKSYSNYLGAKDNKISDTIIFTKLGGGNVIVNPNNRNISYEINTSWMSSSDLITASSYLNNNIKSISATVSGAFFQTSNKDDPSIKPKIYGYADDSNGTLSILILYPYTIEKTSDNSLIVKSNIPKVVELTGFKKTSSSTGKQVVLNSSEINFINHSASERFAVKTNNTNQLVNYGFNLSPKSFFDFSIQNDALNISPSTINNNLFLDQLFKDNSIINWELTGTSGQFSNYSNAKSSYFINDEATFNSYLNNFNYGNAYPAYLLTMINTADRNNSQKFNVPALANVFSITDDRFSGPWVVDYEEMANSNLFKNMYVNYLEYLKKIGIFNANANLFSSNISIQGLSDTNRFIEINNLFGSALPKLLNDSDFTTYINNLNSFNFNINGESSMSISPVNLNDTLAYYPNGPVILKTADSKTNGDMPYMIDATSVFVWNDNQGISNLSIENNNIFSSIENLKFNLEQLGLTNENFGNTYFTMDNNGGIGSDLSQYTASEFILNEDLRSSITVNAYNSIIANNDNSTITLTADDQAGKIKVTIEPLASTQLNETYKTYGINSMTKFNSMTSAQMANLLNSELVTGLVYEFEITGFKQTSSSSTDTNYQYDYNHPTEMYLKSSILGPDFEYNYEKFKNDQEALKEFEAAFIASSLSQLDKDQFVYYEPGTNNISPKLFSNGKLNYDLFNRIINKFNLVSKDTYNTYVYEVWFEPYTLKDVNNNFNTSIAKVTLTIDATGDYSSWVANDYIATGLSLAYESNSKPTPWEENKISKTEFINDFADLLLNKISVENGVNYLRFFQNGNLKDIKDNQIFPPSRIEVENIPTNNNQTYNMYLARTSPIIFGYETNYGYEYESNGNSISQNFATSIIDFSNWNFTLSSVSGITSTSISLSYEPSIWKEDGKYTTSNIGTKTITFGEIFPENEIWKTELSNNKISSYDTNLTPKNIYDAISAQSGDIYNNILRLVNQNINNLPDEGTYQIILKPQSGYSDPSTQEQYWHDAQKDGIFDIDVYISGKWYNGNEQEPVDTNGEQLLGTITIYNLKKAKITRILSNYTIPNINSYNLVSTLAQYFWMKSYEVYNTSATQWIGLDSIYGDNKINDVIQNGIIVDRFVDGTSDTTIKFDASKATSDNLYFDNSTGSIEFASGDIKLYNKYYDMWGREQDASSIGYDVNTSLTLSGFQTINDEVTSINPSSGEITIPAWTGKLLSTIKEEDIKNVLISNNIIKNYPIGKYGTLGLSQEEINDLLTIKIINSDPIKGTIKFSYEINAIITNNYVNADGSSKKVIAINNNPLFADQTFLKGELTINNLAKIDSVTSISKVGTTVASLSNKIITAMMIANNIKLNDYYDASNSFIKSLIDILIERNLIQNTPDGFSANNVMIAIKNADNLSGVISLDIKLNKYYHDDNNDGTIEIYDQPEFSQNAIGSTIIGGFKTIAGATELKLEDNTISVNIDGNQTADSITDEELKNIIYKYLNTIFVNLPTISTKSDPSQPNNNPTISINDIIVSGKTIIDENSVQINVQLESYFYNDDTYNTVVWSKDSETIVKKDFGNIIIKGFNQRAETQFVDEIYLNSSDGEIVNSFPSKVFDNLNFYLALRQIIYNKGLIGSLPEGFGLNNIQIVQFVSYDNLNGELKVEFSIDKYYDADGNEQSNPLKTHTVTFKGLRSTLPTSVINDYNGKLNNIINTKYAYEFTKDDIINLLFNYLVINRTDSFSKSDIDVKSGSISYNNMNGELSFIPLIKNYYNQNGTITGTYSDSFGRVIVTGFKVINTFTTINGSYNMPSEYAQSLAISFLDYQTSSKIQATSSFKDFLIEYIIENEPNDLTQDDISVSNIYVNNITGTITATVSISKYISSNGEYVSSGNLLSNEVVLTGFGNYNQTTISSTLTISHEYQKLGATEFLKSKDFDANEILKQFVFDNIQNKWPADFNQRNEFSINNIKIANIQSQNINGTITLELGIYQYIDSNGNYCRINNNEQPLIFSITINGFTPKHSSEIITSFVVPNVSDIYAYDYQTSIKDVKKLIYENLLINKIEGKTSQDDISYEIIEIDNNNGSIELKVTWNKNYYDYNGTPITTETSNDTKPTANVVLSGFKPLAAKTSIIPQIDISGERYLNNTINYYTPEEFAKPDNIKENENLIKKVILENLQNVPRKKVNNVYEIELGLDDIEIQQKAMSDNKKYLGIVNNFDGKLTVEFLIPIYFNDEFEYVNAKENTNEQWLSLTTTLIGFKKTNEKGTTISGNINVQDTKFNNTAAQIYRNLTSKQLTTDNILEWTVLKSGSIKNWKSWDNLDNEIKNSPYSTELEPLYQKMEIQISNRNYNSATLKIRIQDYTSPVDGIYTTGIWSQWYQINITGLKPIEQTTIKSSLDVSNYTSPDISNYEAGTSYSDINVWNVTDNDLNVIVQSLLDQLINNPTSEVQKVIDSDFYNDSNFAKYFTITGISRDGLSGSIQFNLVLNNYYNSDGDVITSGKEPLSSTVQLFGFTKAKKTIINQTVSLTEYANFSPSELYENPDGYLSDIVDTNITKFITNAPDEFINDSLRKNFYKISVKSFDNINGTITFNLSLNWYFNELGNEIVNNGPPLTKTITITGLKKTQPTEVISQISIQQLGWKDNVKLEDTNNSNFNRQLKNYLIEYQNNINNKNKIWTNLINEKNIISDADFDVIINAASANYLNGTIAVSISMKNYYNDFGVKVSSANDTKIFNLVLTGFNTVTAQTEVSELAKTSGVDFSELGNIKYYTVNDDIINDEWANTYLKSIITDEKLKLMFTNLPSDISIDNIVSVQIAKDSFGSYLRDEKSGTITLNITLNNYFTKTTNPDSIIKENSNKQFRTIKITGFQKIDATTVVSEYDISHTTIANSLSDISTNDLNEVLNEEEVKANILNNPIYNSDTRNITTQIIVENIDPKNKNGAEGTMVIKVNLKKYYYEDSTGKIQIQENISSESYEIKLTGFTKVYATTVNESVSIIINGESATASEYASGEDNREKIRQILTGDKAKIFSGNYANVDILEIVNPQITSKEEYDKQTTQYRQKVYVDDVQGIIQFRIKYNGYYDENANLQDDENDYKISDKIITIKGLLPNPVNSWKSNANVTSIDVGGISIDQIVINDPSLANKSVLEGVPQKYQVENDIKKLINNPQDLIIQIKEDYWERDNNNGTASIVISIDGWRGSSSNSDNQWFTSDSVFVQSSQRIVKLTYTGYQTVNLEATQQSLIIILSLVGGLILLILIVIIALVVYRKRIN